MANKSDDLKEALGIHLLDRVQNGEKVMTKDGISTVDCASGVLTAALNFLKEFPPTKVLDEAEAAEINTKFDEMRDKLPFKAKYEGLPN